MIQNRLHLIFTDDEISRITLLGDKEELRIIADVHGMSCFQAKRFINNLINIIREKFRLIVIHGYNHGTAIKDMLTDSFINMHVVSKHVDPKNQGVTYMQIV